MGGDHPDVRGEVDDVMDVERETSDIPDGFLCGGIYPGAFNEPGEE